MTLETFHVQPIVNLRSGEVCGGEVLWRPNGAPPTPWHLACLEREAVLSRKITHQAFHFALTLLERLDPQIWLSVNLSTACLEGTHASGATIWEANAPLELLRQRVGQRLVIEITERRFAGEEACALINSLAGDHTIAIDDFGIDDVPLNHMLNLAFGKVKIDRQLVHGVDRDPFRQRFLRWLVAGCRGIGVKVCAEGVETRSEQAFLNQLGVEEGQGWLWSKAIDARTFETLLGGVTAADAAAADHAAADHAAADRAAAGSDGAPKPRPQPGLQAVSQLQPLAMVRRLAGPDRSAHNDGAPAAEGRRRWNAA